MRFSLSCLFIAKLVVMHIDASSAPRSAGDYCRKCQTATATPAEPGDLPIGLASCSSRHSRCVSVRRICGGRGVRSCGTSVADIWRPADVYSGRIHEANAPPICRYNTPPKSNGSQHENREDARAYLADSASRPRRVTEIVSESPRLAISMIDRVGAAVRFRARSCGFASRGRSCIVTAEEHTRTAETLLYMLHAFDSPRAPVK